MQNPINVYSKETQEYIAGLLNQRYGQQVELALCPPCSGANVAPV